MAEDRETKTILHAVTIIAGMANTNIARKARHADAIAPVHSLNYEVVILCPCAPFNFLQLHPELLVS